MFIYLFIFNLLWAWCCSRRRRLPWPCHWNIKAWLLPLIPVSMQPYEPRVAKLPILQQHPIFLNYHRKNKTSICQTYAKSKQKGNLNLHADV